MVIDGEWCHVDGDWDGYKSYIMVCWEMYYVDGDWRRKVLCGLIGGESSHVNCD